MGELTALVLGVGDAFSEVHPPSALVVASGGFLLGIDCPDRYRAVLRWAGERSGQALRLEELDHLLITHVHGDHMNGLEGVAFFKRFVQGRRVQLVASPEVRAALWEERLKASMGALWDGRRFQSMGFDDYFEHLPLGWAGETAVGPFRIRTKRTRHHVPTSALLIEAGGHTLGYSSDTAFDPELIAFLEPAELIVHETNHGPAHTPYEALAALPAELRARMRLIHYPDGFDPEGGSIALLRDGELLKVGQK